MPYTKRIASATAEAAAHIRKLRFTHTRALGPVGRTAGRLGVRAGGLAARVVPLAARRAARAWRPAVPPAPPGPRRPRSARNAVSAFATGPSGWGAPHSFRFTLHGARRHGELGSYVSYRNAYVTYRGSSSA